jgi:hypothetical protein
VEGNEMIDTPPYNLKTNFTSSAESNRRIIGFFAVVQEQATRWFFNKDHLSYTIPYAFKDGCQIVYGPPLPGCPEPLPAFPACECKYCLDYSNGEAKNVKPKWWPE